MAKLPEKKSAIFKKRKEAEDYAEKLRRKGFYPVLKERDKGDYTVVWSAAPNNRV